jgi:hypothetical protein
MITVKPTLFQIMLSFCIVVTTCIIQALAKYEIDIGIIAFPNAASSHQFALLDAGFTFLGSLANFAFIIVLAHLTLIIVNEKGSLFRLFVLGGYGYLLIAFTNTIAYYTTADLTNTLQQYFSSSNNQNNVHQFLWSLPEYKRNYILSRLAEIFFFLWCSLLIKKLYTTSLLKGIFASFLPATLVYLLGYAISKIIGVP